MPRSIVQRLSALAVAAAVATLGTALAPASYADDAPASAKRAAHWQAGELTRGLIHNDQFDVDDYGLTIDTLFALDAVRIAPKKRHRIVRALRGNVGSYIGDGSGGTYAGSVAKMLVAADLAHAKPRAFGGVNLVKRTRSLVDAAGADKGRLKDDVKGGSDFSNLIGQAYALRGLAGTGSPVPSVKRFLLKQQCKAGFFRISYNDGKTNPKLRCATAKRKNRSPDLDATAIALAAMVSARHDGVKGLRKPITRAGGWLRDKQRSNGAFLAGSPAAANSNSTGLAGYALAKAGRRAASLRAAVWLASRQATPRRAHGTKLAKEIGAVAFDDGALRAGRKSGITKTTRDQWRRSTAQAALGLTRLQDKRFRVHLNKHKVRPAGRLRVRANGLVPGEKYVVSVAGKTRAHGRAGVNGIGRERVRVPRSAKPGRRAVVVTGAVTARRGKASVRVQRPGKATALAARKGYAGKCKRKDRKGVTVVVDFRSLGKFRKHKGKTIVRCAPPRFTKQGKVKKRTGLKALRHAGISFKGTRLSGNAYVCRLDGRPARNERIKIQGDRNYKERCIRTPPTSAFWAYWHANGKGKKWRFSSTGAASRNVTPGGFEGWSFARNAERGDYPKPRVRPRRR